MDVTALVASAGNAVIQAVVTDAWEDVRHKLARLFGRGQPDAQIERRLDATREQLAAADPADLRKVRAALAGQWSTRFEDLLTDYPEAEAELAELVEQIRPTSFVAAADHSLAAGRDVNIAAEDASVAAGLIEGSVSLGPMPPGPARG